MSTRSLAVLIVISIYLTWYCKMQLQKLSLPCSAILCFLNCLSILISICGIIREKNWAANGCGSSSAACLIVCIWIGFTRTSGYKRFHSYQSKVLLVPFFSVFNIRTPISFAHLRIFNILCARKNTQTHTANRMELKKTMRYSESVWER